MEQKNSPMAGIQAFGEGLIEKAAALCEYVQNIVFEQVDNFMNGLIGKLAGMAEGFSTKVQSGVGRMKDSVSSMVTPSATPRMEKAASPELSQQVTKGVVEENAGKPSHDISALLQNSGCGDLSKFQYEEVGGQETIHSGCMSAAMARQQAQQKALMEQEVAMSGPGGH